MRYKIILSYDGLNYHGLQKQPGLETIQGIFEKALKNMTQIYIKTSFASRTDKGVHAKGQVAHFDFDKEIENNNFKNGLNKRLPLDIRVIDVKKVKANFHSRHDVKFKRYYYILSKKELSPFQQRYKTYIKNLNYEKVKECILLFNGNHNFAGFAKEVDLSKSNKELKVYFKETRRNLKIYFVSRSFLKNMIRILVGTSILFAENKITKDDISDNFKFLKRGKATLTAPANGLFLDKIFY